MIQKGKSSVTYLSHILLTNCKIEIILPPINLNDIFYTKTYAQPHLVRAVF